MNLMDTIKMYLIKKIILLGKTIYTDVILLTDESIEIILLEMYSKWRLELLNN